MIPGDKWILAKSLARLLRRAGTPRERAKELLRARFTDPLSEPEINSLLRMYWGPAS